MLGAHHLYADAPALVLRCPSCTKVCCASLHRRDASCSTYAVHSCWSSPYPSARTIGVAPDQGVDECGTPGTRATPSHVLRIAGALTHASPCAGRAGRLGEGTSQLLAAADPELAEDATHVPFDRSQTYVQGRSDLAV